MSPPARPKALVPVFEAIPAELTARHRWVVWGYAWRPDPKKPGGGDWTKPPRNARTGALASSTDPTSWATFEETVCAYERGGLDGVGTALAPPVSGVDLDHVVGATGRIEIPEASRIVAELDSYTEVSPSGTGLRIFTLGALPVGWRKTTKHADIPVLELYDSGRYFTVTGHHLPGTPTIVQERTSALASLHARVQAELAPASAAPPEASSSGPHNVDDAALLERIRRSRQGAKFARLFDQGAGPGDDASALDLALCSMLAFWTGRDAARTDRLFRQSALMRPKWDERHFGDGRTYGQATTGKAIQGCDEVWRPAPAEAAPAIGSWIVQALSGTAAGVPAEICARLARYFVARGLPRDVVNAMLLESVGRHGHLSADEVQQMVFSAAAKHQVSGEGEDEVLEPVHIAEVLAETIRHLRTPRPMVSTPFATVNELLGGGFLPGESIALAAISAAGKTDFALTCALHAASQRAPTLFVSLEMTNEALGRRALAERATVHASAMRKGDLTAEDWQRITAAVPELEALPVWFEERVATIAQVADLVSRRRYKFLVVDYLQLLTGPPALRRDQRLETEYISAELKRLAKQYALPVLCASAVVRPPLKDGKPQRITMHSLRRGEQLVHDADVICLLHREPGSQEAEFEVAKGRDTGVGTARLKFWGVYHYFEELTASSSARPRRPADA